jgi:hypothetical protein
MKSIALRVITMDKSLSIKTCDSHLIPLIVEENTSRIPASVFHEQIARIRKQDKSVRLHDISMYHMFLSATHLFTMLHDDIGDIDGSLFLQHRGPLVEDIVFPPSIHYFHPLHMIIMWFREKESLPPPLSHPSASWTLKKKPHKTNTRKTVRWSL